MGGGIAHQLEPHSRATRLGRGLVDGTHSDVVHDGGIDRVDLLGDVSGEADQHVRPDELAHLRHGHVLLSHMDAVRARIARDAGPVVDDEQCPEALAESPCGICHGGKLSIREVLLAQLEDVHTSRARPAQQIGKLARLRGVRGYEIQTRLGKACPALGALVERSHLKASLARIPRALRCWGRASINLMPDKHPVDVLVVGGGIIGLSIAWRLRGAGLGVTVLERGHTGEGTSRVAAGMLAPIAEVEFGEVGRRVLELGLRSAELWPDFVQELAQESGIEVALQATGTLLLARDADEAAELERLLAFRQSLGLRVERLRPSHARELEPALAPTLRLALEVPDDHSIDPRTVLAALRSACLHAGVTLQEDAPVAAVELSADERCVSGLLLESGERLTARDVVLAAGPWTSAIGGLPAHAHVPVRPVKGQILRLRDPEGPGLATRVLRFEGGYLLPRGDGRYVLGATMEERGFELAPTAGGVYELLREARELIPGVSELEIEEISVGLRPSTPDNAPAVGRGALDGLSWATGHHRNGILLAPLTADLVTGLLEPSRRREDHAEMLAACDPLRFAAAHVTGRELGAEAVEVTA